MNYFETLNDGAPCEGKLSCTVLSGGKSGDCIKGLPIAIWPRYPLCLPDFQLDCAEIHLEYHRDLSQEERRIKSRIRTLLPDITDEAMVAWIVYVDEVGRHGCFTKILLR